ncbi:hypothetical protein HUA74_44055 [Myxococcus sp. CA051A]|uniref:hypothetical protein n=1 Tax=Myxococcus sp. CA051A TaxID=2741739 RepID=UPI00157B4FC7|nr:hypothetical protein [Myxococcus sp. CA051A]NTX67644.1 hypothetical protein [Myxococcus sp. CA051A]
MSQDAVQPTLDELVKKSDKLVEKLVEHREALDPSAPDYSERCEAIQSAIHNIRYLSIMAVFTRPGVNLQVINFCRD